MLGHFDTQECQSAKMLLSAPYELVHNYPRASNSAFQEMQFMVILHFSYLH